MTAFAAGLWFADFIFGSIGRCDFVEDLFAKESHELTTGKESVEPLLTGLIDLNLKAGGPVFEVNTDRRFVDLLSTPTRSPDELFFDVVFIQI
jgi:hypothetical protein